MSVNGVIYPLPFDLVDDLDPVTLLGANPMLVVSKNAIPATTFQELIGWVKANQAKATFRHRAGVGSGAHFSGVFLQNLIGTNASYVPYRGTGPALQDLVAGQIDIIVDRASNSLPQVQAKTIRAYAVTDTKRLAALPDVPSVDEASLPGFRVSLWSRMWVPKSTPKEIVGKLNEAIRAALDDPAVQKQYAELGLEPPAPAQRTPEALRAHHKAEVKMVAGDQGGECETLRLQTAGRGRLWGNDMRRSVRGAADSGPLDLGKPDLNRPDLNGAWRDPG